MSIPLRVLLIEDSEDDALLLERELVKGGYAPSCRRVDTIGDLERALASQDWDLVITDHNMPDLDSTQALAAVKRAALDVPVIIVSGSIGEEIAVAAMKAGAHDYIMKEKLARLVPAIERERREWVIRAEHRRALKTITHLAYHDSLTGLANRHEFERRVDEAVKTVGRDTHHALLYFDLDQFKIINDTCGHGAGDELLRNLAGLMREPIRGNDMLARLGGDEFGALLMGCSRPQALGVAERLLRIIQDFRFSWDNKLFTIGASFGLVMIDDPAYTTTGLLQAADMACFAAKDAGRNRIHAYTPNDTELQRRRGEMNWVGRINSALQEDRLVLCSQAIVALKEETAAPRHDEFLLRMRDEQGGLIEPCAFIPAAERYNLMPKIDRWVVRRVFDMLRQEIDAQRRARIGLSFINISGATLSDDGFFDYVREELGRYNVPPEMVCFEVTETAAITSVVAARQFFENIRGCGCKVALDDFGAGMSSFTYLKNIPADFVKIDGTFVRNILIDPMDRSIVETINNIAHVAGLTTIAEFVEESEVIEALKEIGVDYAQGFALGRPEPWSKT